PLSTSPTSCLVWLAACARPTPLPCCRLHGETAAPSSASAPLLERPRPTLPRPGRVSGIPPERPPLPLRGGGLRRRGAKRARAVQRTDTHEGGSQRSADHGKAQVERRLASTTKVRRFGTTRTGGEARDR